MPMTIKETWMLPFKESKAGNNAIAIWRIKVHQIV